MIRIIRQDDKFETAGRGIALGVFDGVHLGHLALMKSLGQACRERGLRPAVFTFSYEGGYGFNHRPIIHEFLMTQAEKIRALEAAGIQEAFLASLNDQLIHLSPLDFLENVIVERLGGALLAIGDDGSFGLHGRGDARFLKDYASTHDLDALIVDPVLWGGEKVSSTRIRKSLLAGDMEEAEAMMTRPFRLTGQVISGRHLGSALGFPTANIAYPTLSALVRRGVYKTQVRLGEERLPAVTSVGIAPSVHRDRRDLLVESYLYDFSGDLYGREIEVTFQTFIRDEETFDSIQALKEQMDRDIRDVRALHAL